MAEASTTKRSSIGKKLGITFGIILLLLVVLYFVVTSSAFFKGFILPRVSKAVGAEITVADASISPFSRVELQQLKVQPPNAEPILQAERVVARYSLMDIIGGKINVSEATLTAPVIRIVESADGKTNLEPLTQQDQAAPEPQKDEAPPQLNIRNVSISNGTVQLVTKHNGTEDLTELSNLNLKLDQIQNGGTGKLEISAAARLQNTGTNGTQNLLAGTLTGNFSFTLDQNLLPQNAKGTGAFTTQKASGDFSDLAGLATRFNADLTSTQVQDLSVAFTKGEQKLGQIRVNGPLDLNKTEGKLNVVIHSIDRNVLNLAGASQGIDFGKTEINSTNIIELSKGGKFISVQGQLQVNSFSITQTNQTTPPVDLVAQYNVAVDQANETALINTFTINGTQNRRSLLTGGLSRPMQLNWGSSSGAVEESAFALTVTNLNLADWRAFAADLNPSGTAALQLTAVSKESGSKVEFDLASRLRNFSAHFDSNQIQNADITLTARGQITELDRVQLSDSRVELAQGGERAATAAASGTYELESGNANLKATLDAALPKLFQLIQIADAKASSGKVTFNGQVKQSGKEQSIAGKFAIENFTGNYGEYVLQNYNVTADTDLQVSEQQIAVRQLAASLRQGNRDGGTLQVSGNMNPETSIGSFEVKLNGLNENGLRPFIAPSLGERQLRSILINGTATAKLNGQDKYALQSELNIANLIIDEPGQTTVPEPIAARLNADMSLDGTVAQIRNLTANVNHGGRPAGQFDVSGQYNLDTGLGKFDLKLAGLNQNAVRTVMPKIGGKDLVTISIDGTASANLQSADDKAVKADFKIANLVVRDPKKSQPDEPLSAQLQLDAATTKQLIELRQFALTLSPTERAQNQLLIAGKLDRSDAEAVNGNLTITADSLDVTKFYDLYAGAETSASAQTKPGTTTPAPAPQATQPSAANEEPEPMNLPVGKITLTANIGQFYLREIAVTNLQLSGVMAGNRVTLSPMQMTMNGAPMKADVDLDLGVRGYAYKLAFSANEIPLAPIANTFMPEVRDQYQGFILANANITGIGTTGTSLRQHLNGQVGFTFTNANITFGPKLQPLLNTVAAALNIPEIAKSPIDWVGTDLQFGAGQIQISRCILRSEAIRVWLQGAIPIADDLNASRLDLPVRLDLRRSLASKLPKEIFFEDTNPQAKYIQLPQFLRTKGTIGSPGIDIDKKSLLKGAISTLLQEKAPDVLQGETGQLIQGILGGGKAPQTNAPPEQPQQGTNQPPSDPVKGLLDRFLKPN